MVNGNGPPSPPTSLPKYLKEGLPKQNPDTLRAIASFAMELADYRETQLHHQLEAAAVDDNDVPPKGMADDEWDQLLVDADAPAKATLTIKTINDNDYYYYQWREGDAIKSEYLAPVSPNR